MGESQIATRHGVPSFVIITYADFAATKMPARSTATTSRKRKSFVDFPVVKGKKTIALVSIRDVVVIEGVLPRVLLHRVLGWCVSHTRELLADWNLVRQGKEPKWIDWTID